MFSTSRNRLYNKRDKGIISDTLGISRTFFHPFCDQFSLLLYRSFQVFDNLIFQCLEGNGVDNKTHNNERQECQYQEKNTEFAFCRFEQDIAPQYYYKYLYLNAKTQRTQRRKAEVENMRSWEDEKISSSQLPNLPTSYSAHLCGLFYFFGTFSQSAKNLLTPSSVSGCWTSRSNTLKGIVATSAPIIAASSTCIGFRILATMISVWNP